MTQTRTTAPLAASARRVLDTLLQERGEAGAPEATDRFEVGEGVAAIIELAGGAGGFIGVHFPRAVGERIVALATGRPASFGTPGFDDAVGELAEMIVVGAAGYPAGAGAGASRPRLVHGGAIDDHGPGFALPIWTECGTFHIWTALRGECAADARRA